MPHLRFRHIAASIVAKLSESLPAPLADTMETSEENFTFELISADFFSMGKPSQGYPFVEVLWFKRSQKIQDKSAETITQQLQLLLPGTDVVVVFMELSTHCYYENGDHFHNS